MWPILAEGLLRCPRHEQTFTPDGLSTSTKLPRSLILTSRLRRTRRSRCSRRRGRRRGRRTRRRRCSRRRGNRRHRRSSRSPRSRRFSCVPSCCSSHSPPLRLIANIMGASTHRRREIVNSYGLRGADHATSLVSSRSNLTPSTKVAPASWLEGAVCCLGPGPVQRPLGSPQGSIRGCHPPLRARPINAPGLLSRA